MSNKHKSNINDDRLTPQETTWRNYAAALGIIMTWLISSTPASASASLALQRSIIKLSTRLTVKEKSHASNSHTPNPIFYPRFFSIIIHYLFPPFYFYLYRLVVFIFIFLYLLSFAVFICLSTLESRQNQKKKKKNSPSFEVPACLALQVH